MYKSKKTCCRKYFGIFMGLLVALFLINVTVFAETNVLESITDEAQIKPINDGTGAYILKSDGFYCLDKDGKTETKAAVHYFNHVDIDGTVLNGFYYHDESGCFVAESSHMVKITKLTCTEGTDESAETVEFDGYYMVNNLGKLSAAPQVRYISDYTVDKTTYDGYYYFDEYGMMVTEPGIHELDMTSNGQSFSGSYYFGGENGALMQEAGVTEEGFAYDATGKICDTDELGIDNLKPQLESMIEGYDGEWSLYVKDLGTGEEIVINETEMGSASLIKLFVMEKTYADMDAILENESSLLSKTSDDEAVQKKIDTLLWNMITVSDNESCNELGRLQSDKHDFKDGAENVNEYLEKEGYSYTSYQSILQPSSSKTVSLGGSSHTSVTDCGKLLEKIYNGECVSENASEEMLNLLLNQENTTKIPAGINATVQIANKTGETDDLQHDAAIVWGEKTNYILCVMSKNAANAIADIRSISGVVYNYLNL